MGDLLLGVDGGNTKTIAVVAYGDGTVVGTGTAGCADIYGAVSPEAAITEVVTASTAALAAAGAAASDVAAAAFSLAGADWPEDFELHRRELTARIGLVSETLVVNDAIGAIRSGTDDNVGVAAVCGTGGAVGARNRRGEVFHLGFWPDGTGAMTLGSDAVAAIWRAGIGLGPETSLTGRALDRWGCSDPLDLLHAFTRRGGLPRSERGLFADAVLDEAEGGDAVAREIVKRAGAHLGDHAHVCATRTGQLGAPFPLVLSGGVMRHRSILLREAILERLPDAEPIYPAVEPVAGAVLLAADRVGARPDPARLKAALTWAADNGQRLGGISILAAPEQHTEGY